MRKSIIILFCVLIGGIVYYFKLQRSNSTNNISADELSERMEPPASGPDLQRWFFNKWHEPYDAMLSPEYLDKTWRDIRNLPSEVELENPTTHWLCIGPKGMKRGADVTYSGRILDVAVPRDGAKLRIAAASGGLWEYKPIPFYLKPIPLTNRLNSQVVSTFATEPGNKNNIIIGTGEFWVRGGRGMFRKTQGTGWIPILLVPQPQVVYRVRYTPNTPNIVHSVTSAGYFRSDDGGITWTQHFTGNITDIAIDPLATHLLYVTRWGINGGVYKSTDGGDNWVLLTNGIPTTNVGRSSIALCKSNAKTLYACLGRDDNEQLLGIYKSTDNGQSWFDVSPPQPAVIGGNAWYNNVISVCPTNDNIVLAGMTHLLRTTNGGTSWSKINTPRVHVDHHAFAWTDDGMTVWNGNDGGITKSTDQGATWVTEGNTFPITQFYNIDVSKTNPTITFGGSQDNGLIGTTTGGEIWNQRKGGDGSGICIDPEDPTKIYAAVFHGGPVAYRRYRSTNTGLQWITFTIGIMGDINWAPKIRSNRLDADKLYTNASEYVYVSETPHDIWFKVNSTPFPSPVSEVTVSTDNTIYACLDSLVPFVPQDKRLYVYVNENWYERSDGLPPQNRVRKVVPHPIWPHKAYALMNGLGSPGEQVFRTTDAGLNWTNVTGNLPNVPVADLVPYPSLFQDNTLFLGTEFGCFKTTNGGTNWFRWNYGMPEANIISEMVTIDSLLINGKFYIVAGTYGRSIWKREIHNNDPTVITAAGSQIPERAVLHQNYPNPFNPVTTIDYDLQKSGEVTLEVFTLTGRKVVTLVDSYQSAGRQSVRWDGRNSHGRPVASGVYMYRLETKGFQKIKKLTLLR